MLHDNNTPYAAIGFEQWHRDGQTMACIAVRAEMVFGDEGKVRLAEKQDIVLMDEFDGDPQKTPLIRPNDLVPFKPGTDITFLGSLHSPDKSPKPYLTGSIAIAGYKKSIRGYGPREWIKKGKTWILSDPESISELPLCYTKASGGRFIGDPDGTIDPRNPIGANLIDTEFTPKSRTYAAAQIDNEDHPIHDNFQRPPLPQGFGPMSPWWKARQQYVGTYSEDWDWDSDAVPSLPKDFNYRFYNCAHPDLVFRGFWSGGNRIELTNLSPTGNIIFHLPKHQPFARFSFTDGREVTAALNLDGIHIDFRTQPHRYALTWRGWIDICPAFYRIDLEYDTLEKISDMALPVVCEEGLREPV